MPDERSISALDDYTKALDAEVVAQTALKAARQVAAQTLVDLQSEVK